MRDSTPFVALRLGHPLPDDCALLLPAQALLSKVFERKKGRFSARAPRGKASFF